MLPIFWEELFPKYGFSISLFFKCIGLLVEVYTKENMPIRVGDVTGWPDLADKNTHCLVKIEFWINNLGSLDK